MIALWLTACFVDPPPPATLAVDARWPRHDVVQVDAELSTALSAVLTPHSPLVRCEAVNDAVRCTVEGATAPDIEAALHQAQRSLPKGVEGMRVRPLPAPPVEATWLVLDDGPAAWVWDPAVVVHRRWPIPRVTAGDGHGRIDGVALEPVEVVRCDAAAATALWVDQLPTVPPPDGVAVRTWRVEEPVFVQGPAGAAGLAEALAGIPHCVAVGPERAEAVVQGSAVQLAEALPAFDVVPREALSRRWALGEVPTEERMTQLRALSGVLAARWVGPIERPVTEWVVDPDAVAAHGLQLEAVVAALQGAEPVAVGGLVLPGRAAQHVEGPQGPVPLAAVASSVVTEAPAVRVRVNGVEAGVLEVLVAGSAAQDAVDHLIAAAALEPWAMRAHRP